MKKTSNLSSKTGTNLCKKITKPKKQVNATRKKKTSDVTKPYQANAMNWFLTFPQCDIPKQSAIENIVAKENLQVKGVIVAQEHHADGSLHLHVGVFLKKRLRTRDQNFWDFVCGKHGSYEPMYSIQGSLKYLHKEDTKCAIHGEVPELQVSKGSKSDTVAGMICSGASLQEIATKMPGYFLLNKKKIEDFKSWTMNLEVTRSLLPLHMPLDTTGMNENTRSIADWLNTNLLKNRAFKQKQLYVWGEANLGKTSMILQIQKYLRVYFVPMTEDFYDFYSDEDYDLIVFDEFRGQKTVTFMNAFLQGGFYNIRKKGSQYMKTKNLPSIILSNYDPSTIYKDPMKTSTFLARLETVHVEEFINIEFKTRQETSGSNTNATSISSIQSSEEEEDDGNGNGRKGNAPCNDDEELEEEIPLDPYHNPEKDEAVEEQGDPESPDLVDTVFLRTQPDAYIYDPDRDFRIEDYDIWNDLFPGNSDKSDTD